MERRFDMTDFEQSLKDHADQFVMEPSKRVWHGIYNNLHPGSTWPSITVGLVFLFTFVTIGYLNNTKQIPDNSIPGITKKVATPQNQVTSQNPGAAAVNAGNVPGSKKYPAINSRHSIAANTGSLRENRTIAANEVADENEGSTIVANSSSTYQSINTIPGQTEKKNQTDGTSPVNNKLPIDNQESITNPTKKTFIARGLSPQKEYERIILHAALRKAKEPAFIVNHNKSVTNSNVSSIALTNGVFESLPETPAHAADQSGIIHTGESIAVPGTYNPVLNKGNKDGKNKPVAIHKKKNAKITWRYFATPTVSSVLFRGKAIPENTNQNFSPNIIQPEQNGRNRLYNARLGYEAGAEITYSFIKDWAFISGVTLSYSGYNVISNQVHPTFANLMLTDEQTGIVYAKSYITHYGNGEGQNQILLSNKSVQLTLPVGLQFVLWGNKNAKITLASTIGPSIVLKSNAYILSSDGRNYVSDPDLLRKLNASGHLASYVTFSTKKIKWQVGPSVRYQILSSYEKYYPVKEHLIDYGIRIGIFR